METVKILSRSGDRVAMGSLSNTWDIHHYEGYNIPVLYLEGVVGEMNKDTAVPMSYIYGERSGSCTVKWQGSSSKDFPKKNYTVVFDEGFEVVTGWGIQSKYCLKANFVDPSHARNLISARLWGQTVKSRTPANEMLNALPNGGAVDGFPVVLSLNGKFHGLYTWNIPKDSWMFGMSGAGAEEAILCADGSDSNAVVFRGTADLESDFALEYSSDGQSGWVKDRINQLIEAVMDSDGSNIATEITPRIDWESAIDYYIHTVLTTGYDGVRRNYLLATFDGVKWFFSGYDMDTTFGAASLGKYFVDAGHSPTFRSMAQDHKLFELIWTFMRPALRKRYWQLRESVMSEGNLATEFWNFASGIPLPILVDDVVRWKRIPSSLSSCTEQILNQYRLRVLQADQWIEDTEGEQELPETPAEVYRNLVPESISADGNIYNGIGYKNGTRLSSSGGESTQAGACVTGFIPYSYGRVIRMVGATGSVTNSGMYLGFFDSSFSVLKVEYLNALTTAPNGSYVQRSDGLYEATINTGAYSSGSLYESMLAAAYIRVSLNPCDGANMIVTFDQEIPDA